MNQQILIEELTPSQAGVIVEASQDGLNTWLNGVFMQAEIQNRNGRVYPLAEINSAVVSAQQKIQESNGIFGELDHPQGLNINLDRISHTITQMDMQGNNAVGKIKLLNTPMGNIAKELVKSGVKIGVSSRGAGSVNESGGVTGFNFVTIDLVATPSAMGAVPDTVYESLEMHKKGQQIMSLAESVKHDPAAQKYFEREIKNWLNTDLFAKK